MESSAGRGWAAMGPLGGAPCEERTGLARRLCRLVRRLLVLAGRGGSSGVPF